MVYGNNELDMKTENTITELETPEDGLVLEPNRLYLGRTFEFTETKSMFQRWKDDLRLEDLVCLLMSQFSTNPPLCGRLNKSPGCYVK